MIAPLNLAHMKSAVSILWFRSDLRLADNPALEAAMSRGGPVIPVFIWAPEEEGDWPLGARSRGWLRQSLGALSADLERAGSRLIVRRGQSLDTLLDLVRRTGASAVFWNRRYEPSSIARDRRVAEQLDAQHIHNASFNAALLYEPWTIQTQTGTPYQVFTAFWRACLAAPPPPPPLKAPTQLRAPAQWPASLQLEQLERVGPSALSDEAAGFWTPGAKSAHEQLVRFLKRALAPYDEDRDRPDLAGTSRLSPHLHFGEISPRQILHALKQHGAALGPPDTAWRNSQFLTEIGWREFAHHLLYHYPHTPNAPLRPLFERFPWHTNGELFDAWRDGRTGYPLVDAGMRQLKAIGWMHNRVRMVVASFLVKDLLISWTCGAKWFWEALVDADLPNNTLGWQWCAGCGADAAPFFRIFNPATQGAKFDPEGHYVRTWVPELARLDTRWIHCPWQAPEAELSAAGVKWGRNYPAPAVQHSIAREVALDAYARMRRATGANYRLFKEGVGQGENV